MIKAGLWVLAMGMAAFGYQPVVAAPEIALASANEMLAACDGNDNWNQGECYGFILGVYRGIETIDEVQHRNIICVSNQVTIQQVYLITRKYLYSNPKLMSDPAEYAVTLALLDAFPCPKT